MKNVLGQMLIAEGAITKEQLEAARDLQARNGMRLGSCLVELGAVAPDVISRAVSRQLKARPIKESEIKIDPDLIRRVSVNVALDYELIPLRAQDDTLEVVIGQPINYVGLEELKIRTGFGKVVVYVASQDTVRRLISKHYGRVRAGARSILPDSNPKEPSQPAS